MPTTTTTTTTTTPQDYRRSGTATDAELAPVLAAMRATGYAPLQHGDDTTEQPGGQLTVAVPGEALQLF